MYPNIFKGGINLAIGLIVFGIIVFLIGFLTPVSNSITLLISIVVFGFGISRLLRRKEN